MREAKADHPPSMNNAKVGRLIPNLTVDCVILGFHDKCMKILLHKEENASKWMLPWAFIKIDEDVDVTALNVLKSKTGLTDAYLKQFHLFGKHHEEYTEDSAASIKINSTESIENNWVHQRCLSLAYYGLVKHQDVKEEGCSANLAWFSMQDLPPIYDDHRFEINTAVSIIRQQLGFVPIGFELLPEKFTMPELRTIYETIIGKEMDRRNFQRKILAAGVIIPLNETRKSGPYKSPNLYKFDLKKYENARKFGLQLTSFKLK